MAMNQSCYAVKSDAVGSQYYLYFALKREIVKLKKMASGGVFDTIIVKTFDHIQLSVPSQEIVALFDNTVAPIMEQLQKLALQNQNLAKQRDLLLPRLMSGKLEVH
jgi:type I restriction enzyme S subunit